MHCRNGMRNDGMFAQSARTIGDFPVFTPEVYTAWYSIWGGEIATRSIPEQLQWTNWLIDKRYSFCLYMFHGGTNFGFSAGSNQWRPVQTTYDYDAPVDEAGRVTEKYRVMRELLSQRFARELPDIPPDPPSIEIPAFTLTQRRPLLEMLPSKPTTVSADTVSMEDLDQGHGFVLYRKQFDAGLNGTLELLRALDYAIVMVNGKTVGRSFVGYGRESTRIQLNEPGPATLDILVHNLGRTSSPFNQSTGRKGLIDGATLAGKKLSDWQIHSLPMDTIDFKPSDAPHVGPTLYRGTFTLEQVGETFLDMRKWGFGVVWVNGHNLGRYWDRGALRSLYLPSAWQKVGANEIVILELDDEPKSPQVGGVKSIVSEPAKAFGFQGR
jgi:beta-galactosidase